MYIIVVGAGNIGTPLIEIATEGGNEVVVVKRDEAKAEAAAATFGCFVLNDDVTVKQTLGEAGADRADAIITTTNRDTTNTMVCLLTKELDILDIVSVVHNPEYMNLYRQIGVSTTEDPQRLIAEYLYRMAKRPSIVDYTRIGEHAEVFEIRVDEDASITGTTIQEAVQENLLDGDTLIVAVEREGDDNPVTSRGNTAIDAGDLLAVYSTKGATPEVTGVFGHYEDH